MNESTYDEDLTTNIFFQKLKVEYNHLLEQVTAGGWIICIPKAGSFETTSLTEDEYLYHILIPREDCMGTLYQTLNGEKVTVCNKVIKIEDKSTSSSLNTPILFEETFYTDDFLMYKVWCIECLLKHNCLISKFKSGSLSSLLTLRECIDFLWTESLGKQILEQLDIAINDFLLKNSAFYKFSLEAQRDFVKNLYAECLEIALTDTKLSESIKRNKHILSNTNVAVEAYMQHNIYKILFSSITVHTACDDSAFNKIIRNLSDIQLRDLDIKPDFYEAIPHAKLQLAKINGFSTILGKISCLRYTVSEISQSYCKCQSALLVDDLLPVFVFLILKTCIPNWIANLNFLKQFQFSFLSTGDEANFLITTVEAAIEYIRSGILLTPSEPDNCINHFKMESEKKYSDGYRNQIFYFFEQIRFGNYSEIKNILEENNASQNEFDTKSKELCHPLCSCDKCEKLIAHILCNTKPTVHSANDKGYTALHIACMYGKPKIVELLLEHKANIQKCDYSGASALHYAAMRGHQNALLLLLHSGANINATDNEGNTALHFCCNNGHDACVKAILYFAEHQCNTLNVNCVNHGGETPLHHAAKWGYTSIVHLLLEYGADPNTENKFKKTPYDCAHNLIIYQIMLHAKFQYKEIDEKKLIVTKQYDQSDLDLDFVEIESVVEEKPTKPCSPQQMKKAELLLRAVTYEDIPMICYYLGLPNDIHANKNDLSLCHPLCNCEKCENVQNGYSIHVNDKQDINICNSEGYTALHVASLHGQTEIVKLLLNNGALPNIVTNKGLTALHLACQTQRQAIVHILLQCEGCKINLQDIKGNTALHYACYSRDIYIIKALLQHEANTKIRNLNGKTPLDEADRKIVDFIISLSDRK